MFGEALGSLSGRCFATVRGPFSSFRQEICRLSLGVLLGVFSCRRADERFTGPWNLPTLKSVPPVVWGASTGDVREVYYESVPHAGRPTRVFAYYACPTNAPDPVQGIALIHGAGKGGQCRLGVVLGRPGLRGALDSDSIVARSRPSNVPAHRRRANDVRLRTDTRSRRSDAAGLLARDRGGTNHKERKGLDPSNPHGSLLAKSECPVHHRGVKYAG